MYILKIWLSLRWNLQQFDMNEIIQNIITRRSVKSYKNVMPPMRLIEEICKAGSYAPSGMGAQSPIIIAVTNKEMRDRLSRINLQIVTNNNLTTSSGHSDPFYGAPCVLVVLAEKSRGTRVYDGSLVMANLMLAAHAGYSAPKRLSRPKKARRYWKAWA